MYVVQINKQTLQNHWQYDWWKYLVGIIATIFMWNIVSTVTRPQTPADKKVEIFLVGDYVIEDKVESLSQEILDNFPELLEANFTNIPLGVDPQMDYVGHQKLMVMIGSQTGDIYFFEKEQFKQFAEQGAFLPLDDYIDDDLIQLVPKDKLEEYKIKAEEDIKLHYYGIPLEGIDILDETGYDVSDKVVGIMAYSKNKDKAFAVLKWLLKK